MTHEFTDPKLANDITMLDDKLSKSFGNITAARDTIRGWYPSHLLPKEAASCPLSCPKAYELLQGRSLFFYGSKFVFRHDQNRLQNSRWSPVHSRTSLFPLLGSITILSGSSPVRLVIYGTVSKSKFLKLTLLDFNVQIMFNLKKTVSDLHLQTF